MKWGFLKDLVKPDGQSLGNVQRKTVSLPEFSTPFQENPEFYIPDDRLVEAVEVAVFLRQPLLITGEPGTGKTELARFVAHKLELGDPLKFEVKSTSLARDLFYTYDTLGRFHAAQDSNNKQEAKDFIEFQALGRAIIQASDPEDQNLKKWFGETAANKIDRKTSLVLIDEIDKAPRDFPNDILNEIDRLYFRIPEVSNTRFSALDKHRPIVIVTSNSEKHLPDAFLRRCIYYDIPFPSDERLKEIVSKRIGHHWSHIEPYWLEILAFFRMLRETMNLEKKPSTSEMLNWLIALHKIIEVKKPESPIVEKNSGIIKSTLPVLLKSKNDLNRSDEFIEKFPSFYKNG